MALLSDNWAVVMVKRMGVYGMKVDADAGVLYMIGAWSFDDKANIVHYCVVADQSRKKKLTDDEKGSTTNAYSSNKKVETTTKVIAPITPVTQ
jgi:hypothetical protein